MAKNTTIQMFDDGATIGDSVATIDIPDDGEINAIYLSIRGLTLDLEGDRAEAQLSFGSTSSFATNDGRTVLAHVDVAASGAGAITNVSARSKTMMTFPDGIQVFAGERIHMHTRIDGGGTVGDATGIIVFAFRKFSARRR